MVRVRTWSQKIDLRRKENEVNEWHQLGRRIKGCILGDQLLTTYPQQATLMRDLRMNLVGIRYKFTYSTTATVTSSNTSLHYPSTSKLHLHFLFLSLLIQPRRQAVGQVLHIWKNWDSSKPESFWPTVSGRTSVLMIHDYTHSAPRTALEDHQKFARGDQSSNMCACSYIEM